MTSISKFSTALLSVPNELTVAAANFNLNFSLMKVEAPPEFHGLRDSLSKRRRHEAEEGDQHVTARCLGALFESLIPLIPNITAAYGERVSEISQQLNSTSSPAGMFSDRAGADGTSIWAAATSGQHAIAMHLLACMLARMWKPAEATSLWVELVERRKTEIFKTYTASTATGIPSIMAAQQLFRRDQLSAWDASARSWLQAADSTKRRDQTELMLMINNVHMAVNTSEEPFESVVAAWTSGMNTMERLICGTPQRVQDGAILVAISSWHLYPNIQVLSDRTTDIKPGDKLMARSMLTVSSSRISDAREGVYWSLPLSRMRYYSAPVITERNLASDTSRVSIEEFHIVFLGALVGHWKRICLDEERCCRLIVILRKAYRKIDKDVPQWFNILSNAASLVVDSKGPLQAQYRKLLKLGSRRCTAFLHDPKYEPPAMFGLEYFHVLIRSLKDVEERIRVLRNAAEARDEGHKGNLLLRYSHKPPKTVYSRQFATVYPARRTSHTHGTHQDPMPSMVHQRFALGIGCDDDCHVGVEESCNNNSDTYPKLKFECVNLCSDEQPCLGCSKDRPCTGCTADRPCVGCWNARRQLKLASEGEDAFLVHPDALKIPYDYQFECQSPGRKIPTTYWLWFGHGQLAAVFRGQDNVTRDIYCKDLKDEPSATMDEIEAVVASSSFDPTGLELRSCCYHWSGEGLRQQTCSFNALVFATNIYKSMKESTISIEVINSKMYESVWAQSIEHEDFVFPDQYHMWWHTDDYSNPEKVHKDSNTWSRSNLAEAMKADLFWFREEVETLGDRSKSKRGQAAYNVPMPANVSRPIVHQKDYGNRHSLHQDWQASQEGASKELKRAFACIAWFDSGEFNIPLQNLNGVMALANGASIYVASGLLADPSVQSTDTPIRRVFGNLGRSEMCLLVPPGEPRLADPDVRSWKLINHSAFDGQFQDCFGGTTLHLTFTDSEDAVFVGNRGLRDRQVVILEALISIDDRGRNIGDLDILSMFTNPSFRVHELCEHTSSPAAASVADWAMTSLDCWEEFLDPPSGAAIFRAKGNWQARLGAAAAATQMGKHVVVLPGKSCLRCLANCKKSHINVIIA
ncbi:hypothetical protein IQ07DRAFT_583943 [Pyrenochaeta sp. DS3sAY3a]|nr:hypothetical protein IQ07DRAFT_583943 [Pyrenochaeta sp. DS3sAY3a]